MEKQEVFYKRVGKYYYDDTNIIGMGGFGKVYTAFKEDDESTKLAVKVVSISHLFEKPGLKELFIREIDILRQLQGSHIIKLVDVLQTVNNLYIFMDYCDGGALQAKLDVEKLFSEEQTLSIAKQIASVFVTLDQAEITNFKGNKIAIMHRDIKPANILFHQGQVKLADFGFAKVVEDVDKDYRARHTTLGSPMYSPPQILEREKYSAKCDVWSTGVVLYQALVGKMPWQARSVGELIANIRKKPLEFPEFVTASDARPDQRHASGR